jgi:hypothetical protein
MVGVLNKPPGVNVPFEAGATCPLGVVGAEVVPPQAIRRNTTRFKTTKKRMNGFRALPQLQKIRHSNKGFCTNLRNKRIPASDTKTVKTPTATLNLGKNV